MDELIIGDKRYISSKRAATITGYAKDYVGQLCREGRVPARLVGRSWYVLESAIQDHRFGEELVHEEGAVVQEPKQEEKERPQTRYEPIEPESLPTLTEAQETDTKSIHEAWRAWFDRGDNKTEEALGITRSDLVNEDRGGGTGEREEDVAEEEKSEEESAEREETVAIKAIHHELPSIDMIRPKNPTRESPEEDRVVVIQEKRIKSAHRPVYSLIRVAAIVISLLSAAAAVIGSGYADTYIASNSQVRMLAGVVLYNK